MALQAAAAAAQNAQNAGALGGPRHGSAAGQPRGRAKPGSYGLGGQQPQQQQRTNPGFGQAMQVTTAASCRSERRLCVCSPRPQRRRSYLFFCHAQSVTRITHRLPCQLTYGKQADALRIQQLQGAAGRSSSGLLGEGGAAAYIRRAQSSPGGYSLVNGSSLDQQQQVRVVQFADFFRALSIC